MSSTDTTRCPAHTKTTVQEQRKEYDRARKHDPYRALYNTRDWRDRIRPAALRRDPFCKIALICVAQRGDPAPSEVADHITAMRAGGDPTDMDNLQGSLQKMSRPQDSYRGQHLRRQALTD